MTIYSKAFYRAVGIGTKIQLTQFSFPTRVLSSLSKCNEHVLSSQTPSKEIPEINLSRYLMQNWLEYGDKPALSCAESGNQLTYRQAHQAVRNIAHKLKALGLQMNDRVFLISPNCPEYAIVYLAAVSLGATITTNNPAYTAQEIGQAVKLSGSKMVVCDGGILGTVEEALKGLASENPVKEVIVIGNDPKRYHSLQTLMEGDAALDFNDNISSHTHLAALPFSSGTTGLPKGVMLTHRNIVANLIQLNASSLSVEYDDHLGGLLPMFHIYGQVCTTLLGLLKGATIHTMRRFQFTQFLQEIQDNKLTICHLVPPIILGLTKSPATSDFDLSSLRIVSSGAAPLKSSTSLEFQQKFPHTHLLQGYGLTETSPVVTFNSIGDRNKHGSVGTLLCNVNAKVVDVETGKSLPANQEGELYFQGPNVMLGYWTNQEATDDCLDADWFRTGDVGYYDEEGYFYVVDRIKELIKYKGFQVAPAELEAVLISHSDILDAAVVSIPDEAAGELPRAYVVIKPGHEITDQQIHDFLKEKVSDHKQLRGGIRRIGEIPKSVSGKILRRILKEQALNDP